MAIRASIALFVIALLAGGCGGDDNSAAPTGVAAAATTAASEVTEATAPASASTTGAELTLGAAAELYTRIVAPANCAVDHLNAALDSSTTGSEAMKVVVPLYRAAGRAFGQLATDLRAAHWPAAVSDDIETLADASTKESLAMRSAANAHSFDEQQAIVKSDNFINTMKAADASADMVRQKLGLDSTFDDTDFCAIA